MVPQLQPLARDLAVVLPGDGSDLTGRNARVASHVTVPTDLKPEKTSPPRAVGMLPLPDEQIHRTPMARKVTTGGTRTANHQSIEHIF
ncbi:hypothetical protein GCM10009735_37800 [Actinomadura chokoriensis]